MASANWPKRIDGSEVGVDDLVESVVLHDVLSFGLAARICFLVHSSGRCRKSVFVVYFLFFVLLLCLHLTSGKSTMSCDDRHFFVKSSANLERKSNGSLKIGGRIL